MAEVVQTNGRAESGAGVNRAASVAPDDVAREATAACPECGVALVGDYCHRCGEKRPEARDLSVRHFVKEAAREVASLDSKLVHTVRALLLRPGFLTNEWVAGRRGRYLKPLNLCLGVFALNIFAFTATKQVTTFDIGMILENERQTAEQMKLKKGGAFNRLFDRAVARKGVSKESLQDTVNDKWQRNLSLLQPVTIPLLAVLLQLVYIFSRRYFVEHLIFAMHFLAFTALTVTLMWPIYYVIGIHPSGLNMSVAVAKFALDIFYLFVALRAVYGGRTAHAVLRAIFVFAGYFVIYVTTYLIAMTAALISALR